jgi:phage terminase large subunit
MGRLILTGYPNPRQEEFFKARSRHIGYGGARGGGKSWAMRRKFVLLALNYPGIKILLLRRTYPELRENHILPLRTELGEFAKYNDDEKAFTFPNGSRIKLGYCQAEADVLQYQGQEYEVIGLEEATLFTEYQRNFLATCNRTTRTDFSPRMYYTTNPGGVGHGWFKRLFIDRQYQGKEKPEDYVFIPAKVYDNAVLMTANPEYVEELENLPSDLRRAFLDGDWDVFAGQYFSEWRRDIHVVEPFEIPQWWKRFRSLDYGLDMTACYWWAVDGEGTCYAYRELHTPDLNLTQAAQAIVAATPKDEKISYTVASPDLWNRRQDTGKSGLETMSQAGLHGLTRADDRRIPGWRQLKEYLAPYKGEDGELTAHMRFFSTCHNMIRCLPMLVHDDKEPEDASDKPHEITHGPESARYAAMSRPPLRSETEDELRKRRKARAKATQPVVSRITGY